MADGLTAEQVKRVERVNTAGRSAEGLGWLVIAIAPAGAFLFRYTFSVGIVVWLISVLIGSVLIYAGKYILYSDGYHNRAVLWLVLVISLLLVRGLIPLIVTIEAIMALSALGRLFKELGKPERSYKPLPLKSKEVVIFTILVLAGFALLFNFRTNIDNNASNNSANTAQNSLSQ